MGLNALVYLDVAPLAAELRVLLGVEDVVQIESGKQFIPNILFLRQGNRLLVVVQGTKNVQDWWRYVVQAGAKPWGPPPGLCFGPFVDSAAAVLPVVVAGYTPGNDVVFTGHSLGAAVAAMLCSELRRTGWAIRSCLAFACPRYGNADFHAQAVGPFLVANLPNDPVPLLPPDPVFALQTNPTRIRWGGPFSAPAGIRQMGTWAAAGVSPGGLDWVAELAAANIDWRYSPHATFQYIRSTYDGLPSRSDPQVQAYAQFLSDQGLFSPWPSSSASSAAGGLVADQAAGLVADQASTRE
jgi:hypothetical protein